MLIESSRHHDLCEMELSENLMKTKVIRKCSLNKNYYV